MDFIDIFNPINKLDIDDKLHQKITTIFSVHEFIRTKKANNEKRMEIVKNCEINAISRVPQMKHKQTRKIYNIRRTEIVKK